MKILLIITERRKTETMESVYQEMLTRNKRVIFIDLHFHQIYIPKGQMFMSID